MRDARPTATRDRLKTVLSLALLASLTPAPLGAITPPVPLSIRGTWFHGRCDAPLTRLDVDSRTVRFGDSTETWPVRYDPAKTDAQGNLMLHFAEEFVVTQFVYERRVRLLVYYPKGKGVPGTEAVFHRCGVKL